MQPCIGCGKHPSHMTPHIPGDHAALETCLAAGAHDPWHSTWLEADHPAPGLQHTLNLLSIVQPVLHGQALRLPTTRKQGDTVTCSKQDRKCRQQCSRYEVKATSLAVHMTRKLVHICVTAMALSHAGQKGLLCTTWDNRRFRQTCTSSCVHANSAPAFATTSSCPHTMPTTAVLPLSSQPCCVNDGSQRASAHQRSNQ